MATPLEEAILFLAAEAEYLTIEEKGNGIAVSMGDHGREELPDGVGENLSAAIVDALLNIRARAQKKIAAADEMLGLMKPQAAKAKRKR